MKKEENKKNSSGWLYLILYAIIALAAIKCNTSNTNFQSQPQKQNEVSVTHEDINTSNENIDTSYTQNIDNTFTDYFSDYYDEAEELLKTMTLSEKVGQMFLARYPGKETAIEEFKSFHRPGGYVLFSEDFDNKSKEVITNELKSLQEESKIPLFLAVDEEGGKIVRVSNHPELRNEPFKSTQELFNDGGLTAILNDSNEKCRLLKSLGINLNLSPVLDVSTNSSSYVFDRTYGQSAEETANYANAIIKNMNQNGMISVMKHFPGYGNNIDTHTGAAIDARNYEAFTNSDFLPFQAGITAGGPIIMINHNIVKCMDYNYPASLSSEVHNILREELHFSGIIITDDLTMGAVDQYVQSGEAAVQAVLAGNDMIITSSFIKQKQEIITAVNYGIIPEDMVNSAAKRILACKLYYDIIS